MRSDSCFTHSADGASVSWSLLFFWWIAASWFFKVILSCSITLVWTTKYRKYFHLYTDRVKQVNMYVIYPDMLCPYLSFSCRACCRSWTGLGRGVMTLGRPRAWSCFSMLIFLNFSCSAMAAIFSTSSSAVRRDWCGKKTKWAIVTFVNYCDCLIRSYFLLCYIQDY